MGHLFICGCARSGTSVLQRVMNSHERVVLGLERYLRLYRNTGRLSRDLFEKQRFLSLQPGDTFYDTFDHFPGTYDHAASRWHDALWIGDKIPILYQGYDAIFEEFPDAKAIFITRNLWDVAASYKRRALDRSDANWGRTRGVDSAIKDWNDAHRATRDAQARWPGQIQVAIYEQLFGRWEGFEALFDFAGLDVSATVRTALQEQRALAGEIRTTKAAAPEILDAEELRRILMHADTEAYRELNAHWSSQAVDAGEGLAQPRKYQRKDIRICDYRYTLVPGTRVMARGPLPSRLDRGSFFTCLGGAQTFGRFVQKPYPALLETITGVPALNLGYGGGKPEYYLETPGLLDVVNRASCAVVQVMSARGSPNTLIEPRRLDNNMVHYRNSLSTDPEKLFVDHAWRRLLQEHDADTVRRCMEETRSAWIESMRQLLRAITVPKILLWFSTRQAADVQTSLYELPKGERLAALLGPYPQLVNEEMVASLRPLTDHYVECISSRGMPYRLTDRETGEPVAVLQGAADPSMNDYYPSAEMHEDAARLLAPLLGPIVHAR